MKTAIPNERNLGFPRRRSRNWKILRCELGASVVIIDYFSSYSSSASQRGVQMHVVMRPAAAVGDRQIESLRQCRDFYRFGVTTHRADVGLDDVHGAIDDQLAVAKTVPLVLPGSDGDRSMAAQVGQ